MKVSLSCLIPGLRRRREVLPDDGGGVEERRPRREERQGDAEAAEGDPAGT